MKTVTIIIRNIPEELRQALKIRAAQTGKPMQTIILELIQGYVNGK